MNQCTMKAQFAQFPVAPTDSVMSRNLAPDESVYGEIQSKNQV
jgi:hypothetical protein